MTALTTSQLSWLRQELGATPDDDTLQASYDALGTVRDVAISVLRARVHGWLAQPLKVTVSGVASVDYSANVTSVNARIRELAGMDDDPSDDTPADTETGDVMQVFSLTRYRGR